MRFSLSLLVALVVIVQVDTAFSQVTMTGRFVATQVCPAVQSIRKGTNPGHAAVAPGKAYALVGKNKSEATHYWIEVPGAKPFQRWVAISCGRVEGEKQISVAPVPPVSVETSGGTVKPKPSPKGPAGGIPFFVLALSWQPAFCETMRQKPECRNEQATDPAAKNFSLHGLWPQPRRNQFCGVDPKLAAMDDQHMWEALPAPQLSKETKVNLARIMPGTQSVLERHEWIKHGTCYPAPDAETYFRDSIRLTDEVNASVVQDFMEQNIGKTIQTSELRAKFDEAFGHGAGERVRVSCDRAGRISEITIGLKGNVSAGTPIAELIAASEPTDTGCREGLVDAAN